MQMYSHNGFHLLGWVLFKHWPYWSVNHYLKVKSCTLPSAKYPTEPETSAVWERTVHPHLLFPSSFLSPRPPWSHMFRPPQCLWVTPSKPRSLSLFSPQDGHHCHSSHACCLPQHLPLPLLLPSVFSELLGVLSLGLLLVPRSHALTAASPSFTYSFFSSLTSLRSSCHITDTHHKTDQKNPNKAKNNTGPSKVIAVITFIQSELLLPTHALSIDTTSSLSTGTICYEVFAHCLAQKGPPVIASFLYSKEPVPGRCTIFNAAHPRETYILSFFFMLSNQ